MTADHHGPGDLTARARIRDAALTEFADRGIAGATMRGIAATAGVSVGLVQHHFGSKDGLRAACDDLLIEVFGDRLLDLHAQDRLGDSQVLTELFNSSPVLMRYLARAAIDGTDAAERVFDRLADSTEAFFTTTWPDRFGEGRGADAATVMTAMHTGMIILIGQLARRFGQEPESIFGSARISMAIIDVYAAIGEYLASDAGKRIENTVREFQSGQQEK